MTIAAICPSDRMGDHLGGGETHWELNFIKAAQEKNTENVRRISGREESSSVAKIAEISCTHPTHPHR
jgi:hypothetical protein